MNMYEPIHINRAPLGKDVMCGWLDGIYVDQLSFGNELRL